MSTDYYFIVLSQKCQMACKLPFLDVRALLRILKKMNLVQEVHQDIAKTKIAW